MLCLHPIDLYCGPSICRAPAFGNFGRHDAKCLGHVEVYDESMTHILSM